MKHLEAGLVVGGLVLVVMIAALIVWAFIRTIVGDGVGALLVGLVIGVIIVVTIIDWRTEKK